MIEIPASIYIRMEILFVCFSFFFYVLQRWSNNMHFLKKYFQINKLFYVLIDKMP